MAHQRGSKLRKGLIRAVARKRRAEHTDTLPRAEKLSATGVAAIQFTSEIPALSERQKDRVADVIAALDQMNERERKLVKAMSSDHFSDWPEMSPQLPTGAQPDEVVRASSYYSIEAEATERRRNRRLQKLMIIGGTAGFLATWAFQLLTLLQVRH